MTGSHTPIDHIKSVTRRNTHSIQRPMPRKGRRRHLVVEQIASALTSSDMYRNIPYRHESEHEIKQTMSDALRRQVAAIYRELRPHLTDDASKRHAERALIWESSPLPNKVIHHVTVMGVHHRPDFLIDMKKDLDLSVAVEIKKGDSGSLIREGIGQSLVYAAAQEYDFVVYVFVDTSTEGKIRRAVNEPGADSADPNGKRSRWLVQTLWEQFNVWFVVV